MYSIGVDIGGTFIKCALVKKGKIVAKDKVATPKVNDEKLIINTISCLIDKLLNEKRVVKSELQNIGIGVAGSCANGACLFMANAGWRNIRFSKHLQNNQGAGRKR